jgi:hypothetical protein
MVFILVPLNFSLVPLNFSLVPLNFSLVPINFSLVPLNFILAVIVKEKRIMEKICYSSKSCVCACVRETRPVPFPNSSGLPAACLSDYVRAIYNAHKTVRLMVTSSGM